MRWRVSGKFRQRVSGKSKWHVFGKPSLFTDKLLIWSNLFVESCLFPDKYSIVSKRLNTEAVFTIKLPASCV